MSTKNVLRERKSFSLIKTFDERINEGFCNKYNQAKPRNEKLIIDLYNGLYPKAKQGNLSIKPVF